MVKTHKFVYAMVLFLYIFQIARNIDGKLIFFNFLKYPSLLFSLYTIFHLILVTLFYFILFFHYSSLGM